MTAWYNDTDPFAASWLRNLISAGHIAPGDVDTRSIADVQPQDLDGYTQCHFFAGIGGWSLAARLAGWPDDRSLWTGSCPCQPFSGAGKQGGTADARHLWPEFLRLIAERRPAVVVGEQVASRMGREWLTGVRDDLEALAYAVGAADLCAAGQGAPHIRQRLYWVADGDGGRQPQLEERDGEQVGGLEAPQWHDAIGCGLSDRLGDALGARLEGHAGHGDDRHEPGRLDAVEARSARATGWSDFDLISCIDGKARRTEPGVHPLAHGVPQRVGRLRGYGNAVVPQVAAAFMAAWMEALP